MGDGVVICYLSCFAHQPCGVQTLNVSLKSALLTVAAKVNKRMSLRNAPHSDANVPVLCSMGEGLV